MEEIKKGFIQPYFSLGGGILDYTSQLYTYNTRTLHDPNTLNAFFVPAGAGLKINLSKGINLDIGYQVNYANADNLDGYKYGPNNDRFSYTHIGLEFAMGKKSDPQLATQSRIVAVQNEALAQATVANAKHHSGAASNT